MYLVKHDIGKAQVYLEKGFNLMESVTDLEVKESLLLKMAMINRITSNYAKSEKYYNEALKVSYKRLPSGQGVGKIYGGLGRLNFRRKNYSKSLEQTLKAISYTKQFKDEYREATFRGDIAKIYTKLKDFKKAQKHLDTSLTIHRKNNWTKGLEYIYSRLGKIYYYSNNINDIKKSIEYFKAAENIYINNKDINQYTSLQLSIFNAYQKLGDTKSANNHIGIYIKKRDSLNKTYRESKIEEIETKYQTEKKEKDLAKQKLATQEQEILTQKANTRNWLLAFGLLTLGISIFFIWKRYKSEAKAKEIISKQKTQIEKLQKEFHHRLKNDFRSINSYIGLVQRQFTDTNFKERLNELKNRVASMFKVHEILLQEDDITQIKAYPYLLELSQNVEDKYNKENIKVTCNVDKTETIVADKAIPFGIVLNEFVTNSYKYAFDENGGQINIYFESDNENHYLTLKDNGKGLPDDFNIENLGSLGMSIIPMFADLHDGSYKLDGSNGVSLTLTLPKKVA